MEAEDVAPDAETLLNRADIAMYHAKKSGRNRHCWFAMQFADELRFRNELENAIRVGIPAGEFVPYYEQQIDLKSGHLTGFEMLARWNSPRFGLVSPEVFIPVAEEIELISDLSETLIRQALVDARDWHPSLTLSVNISPIQLRDPWFAQRLLRLLVESGFPSGRLEIEITESCLHENINAVRAMIVSLRNQGIRVSLDDFGTGYSSLAQLRSLPFDRLKIDRSFVTEMTRDGGNSELVRAIISLGRGLALPVTAEGIEDLEVLAALQDMGTIKGQGFLYGRPEDAAATRHRLSELNLLADLIEPTALAEAAPIATHAITVAGPSRLAS
jgi:EAL domain-containing protein (putative c-di-GMP-specific phosphodiesterase class I)